MTASDDDCVEVDESDYDDGGGVMIMTMITMLVIIVLVMTVMMIKMIVT